MSVRKVRRDLLGVFRRMITRVAYAGKRRQQVHISQRMCSSENAVALACASRVVVDNQATLPANMFKAIPWVNDSHLRSIST